MLLQLFLRALLIAASLSVLRCVDGYYIPGTYPKEFKRGDELEVEVNSLSSFETELPYDYYSLAFCKPKEGIEKSKSSVNPGTILSGLRMFNSPYKFRMQVEEHTLSACPNGSAGPLSAADAKRFKDKISNRYRVRMVLDNMPITNYDLKKGPTHLRPGFDLGVYDAASKHHYIFNHLVFNVLVHKTHGEFTNAQRGALAGGFEVNTSDRRRRALLALPADMPSAVARALRTSWRRRLADAAGADGGADDDDDYVDGADDTAAAGGVDAASGSGSGASAAPEEMWMVVGFEVMPCSIHRSAGEVPENVSCDPWGHADNPEPQVVQEGADIVYTYDVYWEESAVEWASRWDAYLRMPSGSVHWFSILNSLLVVLVMSVIVAVILMRTVRRDLAKYEELLVEGGEGKDEGGWKLISGDVFRAPARADALAVQVGTGTQIFATFTVTLVLASAGFLSPANRGALLTSAVVLYLLLAIASGAAAVAVWANTQQSPAGWTGICLKTACYFPGITLLVMTLLNILIATTGTSGAIPFAMYFSLVALWFVVSIPLTYVGGFLAAKAPLASWPTRTNQIPRHVPPPPTAADPYVLYAAAGILPFCTVFIELYFAMSSMWQGFFYYLFGFLFIVALLTVVITVEVSVLCTYVQLCAEDYHWWWRSLHRGGAVALYLLIYAIIFLYNGLPDMHGLSVVLYLAYMAIVVLAIHLAMGAVGFASSFLFVYSIFAAVKAD